MWAARGLWCLSLKSPKHFFLTTQHYPVRPTTEFQRTLNSKPEEVGHLTSEKVCRFSELLMAELWKALSLGVCVIGCVSYLTWVHHRTMKDQISFYGHSSGFKATAPGLFTQVAAAQSAIQRVLQNWPNNYWTTCATELTKQLLNNVCYRTDQTITEQHVLQNGQNNHQILLSYGPPVA